ncbi:MAG: TMEM143 family protein [Planctomycetaceae bacterium]
MAKREHYIPVRKSELVELLCRQPEFGESDRALFRQFCRLLDATLHFGYHAQLEELKEAYSGFDPDAENKPLVPRSPAEREGKLATLFDRFIELMERGNFIRLSREHISEALEAASDWGLNLAVDFNVFDRLEIFARGDTMGRRTRRGWRTFFKAEEVPVPVYQRLVLILRMRDVKNLGQVVDTESVYIKVFKEIPKLDLEMLLPGTHVRMSLFDRGRILLPTLSGVAMTLWKIVQGAVTIAVSGFYNSMAFLGLVGGTLGYGLKSFYGYLQTKQKYQLNLTQSLYYQNLDNNGGAICMLLNEAEEQEFREVVLAYYLLLVKGGPTGWLPSQLDRQIEQFLKDAAGLEIDFEIGDAVDKLCRFGLLEESAAPKLRVVSLRAALEALDQKWDNAFDYHQSRTIAPQSAAPEKKCA